MNRREILFRGKRVDNGEWVQGGYVQDKEWARHGIYQLELRGAFYQLVRHEINPDTIGQLHNALTRKVGSNVFVGDIIKHDLEAGLGQPKRTGIVSEITSIEFDFHYYSNVRLLGNKFDNTELTQQS